MTSAGSGNLAHFNIALFPESDELISNCTKSARRILEAYADGYLLGDNAWPHITLCQFIVDESKASSVWSEIANVSIKPVTLHFTHLYTLPGVAIHQDKYWVGLAVPPDAALMSLQKTIYDKLGSLKIEGITKPNVYFPHLTWGRVKPNTSLDFQLLPPDEFWRKEYSFRVSLGRSDENGFGIYRERMFP